MAETRNFDKHENLGNAQYNNSKNETNRKRRIRFWSLLSLGTLIVFTIYLAFFFSLISSNSTPSTPVSKTNTTDNNQKLDFFESNTIYYLKMKSGTHRLEQAVDLLTQSDMTHDKALELISGWGLMLSTYETQEYDQYFYNKIKSDEVDTFVITRAASKSKPEPIVIRIKIIEGKSPTNFFAEYKLSKTFTENQEEKFLYSIKTEYSKYKESDENTRFYKVLEINESSGNLDRLLEIFAAGVKKAIKSNPTDAKKNGSKLKFLFKPSNTDIKFDPSILELELPLIKYERVIHSKETYSYHITKDRKQILKDQSKLQLNRILSIIENKRKQDDTNRQIEIFKGKELVSNNHVNLNTTSSRLKSILSDNSFDSFGDWDKKFSSKTVGASLVDLKNYIDKKIELSDNSTINADNPNYNSVAHKRREIRIRGFIIFILGLICLIFFYQGVRARKKKPGLLIFFVELWKKLKHNQEPTASTGATTSFKKVFKKTNGTDASKEEKFNLKPLTITEMREKLIKLRTDLQHIKSSANDDSIPIRKDVVDELTEADKKIGALIHIENHTKPNIYMLMGEIRKRLEDFRRKCDHKMIHDGVKEIETRLDQLKNIDTSSRISLKDTTITQDTIVKNTPKVSTTTGSLPDPLVVRGWEFIKRVLGKFFEKDVPEEQVEHLAINLLKSPEKIKTLITENKKLIEVNQALITANNKLTENSQKVLKKMADKFEKMAQDSRNESKLYLLISLLNQKTTFSVSKSNIGIITKKLINEQKISRKYRLCAIALFDNLEELKVKYIEEWFWEMLEESFLGKLRNQIEYFKAGGKDARTIYDRILKNDLPLRNIEAAHIRKIIEISHWGQIWDGLIRMSDFFNAYFEDDMEDIKYTLGHHEHQTKRVLNELGFAIEEMKPLTLIPHDYDKVKNPTPINKAYIEGIVLRNLFQMGCKKLIDAALNTPPDQDRVIYVERLGLIDKQTGGLDRRILDLRLGAYNKGVLLAHFSSSGGSTRQNVKDQA